MPGEASPRRRDAATGDEIVAILDAARGWEIRFQEFPMDYMQARSADRAAMLRYFATVGMRVDVARRRRDHPSVDWRSPPDWLATHTRLAKCTTVGQRHSQRPIGDRPPLSPLVLAALATTSRPGVRGAGRRLHVYLRRAHTMIGGVARRC